MEDLKSFACTLYSDFRHATIVNHVSVGKAKAWFQRWLDMDVDYIDIKCRKIGVPATTEDFIRTAKYRNIPFAYCGMSVEVGGEKGWIVGKNASANLNILFAEDSKHRGLILNCHPNWMIKYFDKQGNIIKEFKN